MRALAFFVLGGFVGTLFGLLIGLFLFPFVFAPPPATEELRVEELGERVAHGQFVHADPADPIHYGKGGVSMYPGTVYLHDDFEVGPGPKFHVYLVPKPSIRSSADLGEAMFVDLGRLRAFEGSQNYAIPAGLDLKRYSSVIIWCEQFSVLISPADLTFEAGS